MCKFAKPNPVVMLVADFKKLETYTPKPWHRSLGQRWRTEHAGVDYFWQTIPDPLDAKMVYTIGYAMRLGNHLAVGTTQHRITVAKCRK
jgi:hypothetical protein